MTHWNGWPIGFWGPQPRRVKVIRGIEVGDDQICAYFIYEGKARRMAREWNEGRPSRWTWSVGEENPDRREWWALVPDRTDRALNPLTYRAALRGVLQGR